MLFAAGACQEFLHAAQVQCSNCPPPRLRGGDLQHQLVAAALHHVNLGLPVRDGAQVGMTLGFELRLFALLIGTAHALSESASDGESESKCLYAYIYTYDVYVCLHVHVYVYVYVYNMSNYICIYVCKSIRI